MSALGGRWGNLPAESSHPPSRNNTASPPGLQASAATGATDLGRGAARLGGGLVGGRRGAAGGRVGGLQRVLSQAGGRVDASLQRKPLGWGWKRVLGGLGQGAGLRPARLSRLRCLRPRGAWTARPTASRMGGGDAMPVCGESRHSEAAACCRADSQLDAPASSVWALLLAGAGRCRRMAAGRRAAGRARGANLHGISRLVHTLLRALQVPHDRGSTSGERGKPERSGVGNGRTGDSAETTAAAMQLHTIRETTAGGTPGQPTGAVTAGLVSTRAGSGAGRALAALRAPRQALDPASTATGNILHRIRPYTLLHPHDETPSGDAACTQYATARWVLQHGGRMWAHCRRALEPQPQQPGHQVEKGILRGL